MSDVLRGSGRGLFLSGITFVLIMILGALVLSSYPRISPIDELQHLDSTIKASQGRWYLSPGETFGQEALRTEACSGLDYPFELPPCDSPSFDPARFQEAGLNTAAGRPSLYYVVTGYLARALSWTTGAGFLLSARIVSLLSLALGAALTTWVALRLSGSALLAVSLGVTIAALPPVLGQGITVNPDAWSLLAGVSITALALASRRRGPLAAALLVGLPLTVTILVKPNFVVLAAIPLVVAGLPAWHDAKARRQFLGVLGAVTISGAVFLATMLPAFLGGESAQKAPMVINSTLPPGTPWPWGAATEETLRNFLPFLQASTVDLFEVTNLVGLAVFVGLILIAGPVFAVATEPGTCRPFALGTSAVVSLLLTPLLVFAGQFVIGAYFTFPQRYSFVVLPVIALTWAAFRPRRTWLFAALAALTWLSVLYAYARF